MSEKPMFTNDEDYVEAVRKFINRPIDGDYCRQFCRPLANTESHSKISIYSVNKLIDQKNEAIYRLCEWVSRWIPANPSKQSIVSKHRDAYVTLRDDDEEISGDSALNYVNVFHKDNVFKIDTIMRENRAISLVGARGSGKTAFMNYWLSASNSQLENDKIIWFRVDITKVYDIYNLTHQKNVHEILIRYNRVHTAFVVLLYGGYVRIPNIKQLGESFRDNDLFKKIFYNLSFGEIRSEIDLIQRSISTFVNGIIAVDGKNRIDISREYVKHVLTKENPRLIEAYDAVFSQIASLIRKNEFIYLSIIDGLDNISWTRSDRFYIESCRVIKKFFGSLCERLDGSVKFIIAVRPETMLEIDRYIATDSGQNDTPDRYPLLFEKVFIKVPPPEAILKRKLTAAKESQAFKEERLDIARGIGQEDLSNTITVLINENTSHFGTTIGSIKEQIIAINEMPHGAVRGIMRKFVGKEESEYSQTYLKLLFDNDVRAMIDNYYRVLRVMTVCRNKKIPLYNRPDRMIQYIFLNGYAFMDTETLRTETGKRNSTTQRGSVFPNIFWYDINMHNGNSNNWFGLCGLRVLQMLNYKRTTFGDVVVILGDIFGYPQDLVMECVEAFVAFGLVEVDIHSHIHPLNQSDERTFFSVVNDCDPAIIRESWAPLVITEKAMLYLKYIWSRPDIMYYYALDAPLGVEFVANDTRYIKLSRSFEELQSIEDFYVAAIPTVAVFYRHITHFHKLEMNRIPGKLDASQHKDKIYNYITSVEKFKQYMDLPNYYINYLNTFLRRGISKENPSHASRADRLRRDIEGVINYEGL